MVRTVIGFVVAPSLLPMAAMVALLVGGVEVRELGGIAAFGVFFAAFTYFVALALGVPLFVLFRRKRWNELWRFAAAGAILGLVPMVLISQFGQIPLGLPAVLSIIGAASASLFWVIAVRRAGYNHDA